MQADDDDLYGGYGNEASFAVSCLQIYACWHYAATAACLICTLCVQGAFAPTIFGSQGTASAQGLLLCFTMLKYGRLPLNCQGCTCHRVSVGALQKHSSGLLQGQEQHLMHLPRTHRCAWVLLLAHHQAKCGWAQQLHPPMRK